MSINIMQDAMQRLSEGASDIINETTVNSREDTSNYEGTRDLTLDPIPNPLIPLDDGPTNPLPFEKTKKFVGIYFGIVEIMGRLMLYMIFQI